MPGCRGPWLWASVMTRREGLSGATGMQPRVVSGGDSGGAGGDRTDFLVSHAGADRAWAEWVAWRLAEAGYTVELDVRDWAAAAGDGAAGVEHPGAESGVHRAGRFAGGGAGAAAGRGPGGSAGAARDGRGG
jgi:TIR domain